MRKEFLTVCVILSLFFCYPSIVFAHKIEIVSWYHGGILNLESNFVGGKPVQGGTVKVFDSHGEKLVDGTTDDDGFFSFKATKMDAFEIVISTSCGHKRFLKIPKNSCLKHKESTEFKTENICCIDESKKEFLYPTLDQIEDIFCKHLNKELEEVHKTIARGQRNKVRFIDILGGLGYIVGLIGLATYLKYTRN